VYRAFDPHLRREVALKVPHLGTLDNPRAIERFLREATAAAQLRHPHIVPIYDAGQDGPHYYIASAFIEGRTLADASAEGPLSGATRASCATWRRPCPTPTTWASSTATSSRPT
jgi:serine/threonine protein kinase